MTTPLGVNVKTEQDGDILIIKIDLTAPTTRSASGKTKIIAKTVGPTQVPGTDATLNMSLWRK